MAETKPDPSGRDSLRPTPQNPLEIKMEPALTPRQIQTRLRAGESVEEVAAAAQVTLDWIDPFAAPVLAERAHIAAQAQARPVRRGADTVAHRTLAEVVSDRLASRRVDLGSLRWDAWRTDGRLWSVQVEYDSGKAHRKALFRYDVAARFSVADNDDARWLLGLHSTSHGPQPERRRREESEPTVDLNDDLALVRVVQPAADEGPEPDDTAPLEDFRDDSQDAFREGELTEVDGVYDIVPSQELGLDLIYDMLSGFDEDSVRIYAGLVETAADGADSPVRDEPPVRDESPVQDEPPAPRTPAPQEPEQEPLIEAPGEPASRKEPARPRKSKRAQVPSWDQIMFGAPKKK